MVDPDGKDVEIIKDDEKRTVTIRANFYYNREQLGSEAEVFLNGLKEALDSWEADIKTALTDESLGAVGYDVTTIFNFVESDNPINSAKNDCIGNSLSDDPLFYEAEAEVLNNKYLKANLRNHSRGDNPDAYDVLFYNTVDYQGALKHEVGHFFGLYDRYPEANNPAPYIKDDLMDKTVETRHNAVDPFKRVWVSAGLEKTGSQKALINQNNREHW